MNKKGMSLIEMITALAILATAGLMILTGFMTVYRVFQNANDQSNASDILLSYAERSKEEALIQQVNATTSYETYQIRNASGKQAEGELQIALLQLEERESLPLKNIKGVSLGKIAELSEYKEAMETASQFYQNAIAMETKLGEQYPYHEVIQNLYFENYATGWERFPNLLLPSQIQTSSILPQRIVGRYPWDYIKNDLSIHHGGILIYLSQNYKKEAPNVDSEVLHVVYYYIDKCWYANTGEDFTLAYQGYGEQEISFLYKGNNSVIEDFETLRTYLKAPEYGWKKLDPTSTYEPSNMDAAWR